jgi:hypothetical protein
VLTDDECGGRQVDVAQFRKILGKCVPLLQVDAKVSEKDISNVKLGDKASFTVESMPNEVYHGEVVQIGQSPQTIQNITTYDVVISAPDLELWRKPGMATWSPLWSTGATTCCARQIRRSTIRPTGLRLMVKHCLMARRDFGSFALGSP